LKSGKATVGPHQVVPQRGKTIEVPAERKDPATVAAAQAAAGRLSSVVKKTAVPGVSPEMWRFAATE